MGASTAASPNSDDPRLLGRAVKRIAFGAPEIARRVHELGEEITGAYPDGELLVLGLLKGSFVFLADLVRQIRRPSAGRFHRRVELRRRHGVVRDGQSGVRSRDDA